MLTEIYCSAFGQDKTIPFSMGLNVIQGYKGNSIGKSTALKIVDYAFGGSYYAESNEDIIKNVGEHEICFVHTFGGKPYRFRRSALKAKSKKVTCCKDNSEYTPEKEITLDQFNEWIQEMYTLQGKHCSFREVVGLYSRVWNKPNKEVNRPLYNFSGQTVSNAVLLLVKLFNKYESISEIVEHSEYLRKRKDVLKKAADYHLISVFPTRKEYNSAIKELELLKAKQETLEATLPAFAVENAGSMSSELACKLERRAALQKQQGRIIRQKAHIENNLRQLETVETSNFNSLKDFFPNIDIDRIKEVQNFHCGLQAILKTDLNEELKHIQI